MNKLFTKIASLALGAAMAFGVGVAVSSKEATPVHATETLVYTLNGSTTGTGNSYAGNNSATVGGIAWTIQGNATMAPWRLGGKLSSATNRAVYSNTAITSATAEDISKVVVTLGTKQSNITVNSITIKVGTSANGSETSSETITSNVNSSNATATFSRPSGKSWASKYFSFVLNLSSSNSGSNYYVQFAKAEFYYEQVTSYQVTKNATNCSISGATTVNGSQNEDFTITPSTNYDAPQSITVKAGSTTLTQNTHYSYYVTDYVGYMTLYKSAQTANITITAAGVAQLTVTDSVTHGSLSSTARIHDGEDLDVTINPDSGYTYPTSVTVTMGGSPVAAEYDSNDGTLFYGPVTGNIVVTATCPAAGNTYSITTNVTNGSYSGDTSITDNGGVASVTIAPTGDYKLPDSVSVSGASHTYNADTGVISLSNATGNVTISAAMVALTEYAITVNETNGSHTGASTIKESRTASLTFTPASGFGQPSSVTVSGATSSWTRGTGVLSLSNPTGNVTVTYTAVGNELDSISISANSGSYTLGDNFVMPTVTAKYTVNEDANVTSSASYSGYDPYTTGNQNVTISYTEGGITKTQSYTATVGAASVATTTTWELTALADLTSSDEFVIARTSSTTVALPSNGGAAKPTVSSVTISNNKITSTVTDSILWNVTGNASDGYVFYPKGITESWLYLLDDSNDGVRIGTGSNKHFTLEQGYLYTEETTSPRMIGVYNNADWRCYKLTSGGEPGTNIADQTFGFFKKVETQSGSADLIRITATYKGGDKYVGDPISTSDFTVKKQLNTGNELIDVASGFTISANTLTAESNSITVSYTEGNKTKTDVVVVPATPRSVTLVSVELVQGENVVKEYVDWSGAEWDFTDLSIRRTWSDASTESFNLADLVESEDASVSPAKPAVGVTSFTVSYEYLSVSITNASVTGISVVADYVKSVSWSGKSLSHFKAFSGGQLTSTTVSGWTVKATYAGAGESNALSFGTGANQFTVRIGDSKAVTSLPYTWTTVDDNQFVYVVVGGVAKGDSTHAKTNICASINAIDHTEIVTPAWEEDVEAYVKVSDVDDVTTGRYLIVYEGDSTHHNAAYDGSLDDGSFDANLNFKSVTFDGDNIEIPETDNFYVTITKNTDDYTITSASGVNIGHSTGSNGFNKSGNNTISFNNDGTVNITGTGGIKFQYNYATNSERFRYYKSSQGAVCLYKYVNETIPHEAVTETTHYANDMDHFDAQKKVVEFAKFMNTTMNGTNVCSGTFANLESAWDGVADKYDELFGASTTLNETELAWAKNMLKYATAAWGSDDELACVEKAMKTYEYCSAKYELDGFMSELRSGKIVNPVSILSESTNTITIVIVTAMIGLTAVGGYFFLRKRKENM